MAKGDNKFSMKSIIMFSGILGAVILVYMNIDMADSQPITVTAESQPNKTIVTQQNTIASAWQWKNIPTDKIETHDQVSASRFDEQYIYSALKAVKLDENGDVILDHAAMLALNKALDDDKLKLDRHSLEQLQELIKQGLPGNAGEQTAQVVGDYYQYLGAKKEFHSLYEHTDNLKQNQAQYKELLSVRELYLGNDVATRLFNKVNADAEYMFKSLLLEADTSLDQTQKKQQQALITQRHTQQTIQVDNWHDRYQAFLLDKKNVLNSDLTDNDKRQQVNALMLRHFDQHELERVGHLQLESF